MIEHDIDIKSIFEIFINFIFDTKLSFFLVGDLAGRWKSGGGEREREKEREREYEM